MSDGRRVTSESYATSDAKRSWRIPTFLKLIGLSNFVWVIGLVGLFTLIHLEGTPHVLFEYSHYGSSGVKTSCAYLGLNSQRVPATGGDCPIVTLLKSPN